MRRAPALASVVGPLKPSDNPLAQGGKQRHRGSGRNVALCEHIGAAIGILALHKLSGGHAALAGEALGSLSGIAVGIESDVGRRAALDLMHFIRRRGNSVNQHGQTSRRRHDAHRAMGQAGLGEAALHERAKLLHSVHERRGRHLLGADLE